MTEGGRQTFLRRVSFRGFAGPVRLAPISSTAVPSTAISSIAGELVTDRIVGVTIGNFDGLHLGHQALFNALRQNVQQLVQLRAAAGDKRKACLAVMTFQPHPRAVLARLKGSSVQIAPPVSTLRKKIEFAESAGFDLCISAHFTKGFAALTPEEFVDRFLVQGLNASIVVIGHDWTFGKGRSGNAESLAELGKQHGFKVVVVPPVELHGVRVSTTLLRQKLDHGTIAEVEEILARPYSVSGRIRRGDSRGAKLGYRTANLDLRNLFLPANGVYAARISVLGERYDAVINLGVRPTFGGGPRLLEVHVLDRELGQVYGERMEVEFAERIREERVFASADDLKIQIAHDVESARRILGTAHVAR